MALDLNDLPPETLLRLDDTAIADQGTWDTLWPEPDPEDGDGSEHGETAVDDGTPGASA